MAAAKKVTKEEVKEEVKDVKAAETAKAEPAKTEAAKAEPAKEAAKPAKTTAKKTTAKKTTAKKTTAKKTTAKKAEAKKEEPKTAAKTRTSAAVKDPYIEIQVSGKNISKEALINRIVDKWCEEEGKKPSSIKELSIYIKPEDNAAYYVINGQGDSVEL